VSQPNGVPTFEQPEAPVDRMVIEGLLAALNAGDRSDSGKVVLDLLQSAPARAPQFETAPWSAGDLTGDWVVTPDTRDDAVAIYLHGRRFQHDEPAEVTAAPLSQALGMPVLLLHYRLSPANRYPAALEDVLSAIRSVRKLRPASWIVLVGHSAGGTLALSALTEMSKTGEPMPAAAAIVSAIADFTFTAATHQSNADSGLCPSVPLGV